MVLSIEVGDVMLLKDDYPELGLKAGDIVTVVDDYNAIPPCGHRVAFLDRDGKERQEIIDLHNDWRNGYTFKEPIGAPSRFRTLTKEILNPLIRKQD